MLTLGASVGCYFLAAQPPVKQLYVSGFSFFLSLSPSLTLFTTAQMTLPASNCLFVHCCSPSQLSQSVAATFRKYSLPTFMRSHKNVAGDIYLQCIGGRVAILKLISRLFLNHADAPGNDFCFPHREFCLSPNINYFSLFYRLITPVNPGSVETK
jgi:hypothetical protein